MDRIGNDHIRLRYSGQHEFAEHFKTLPFLPVDGETIVSSTEALAFHEIPKELIVIGAGAIGLELGTVWSRLGAKVKVVELLPQILPGWDKDISKALARELKKQGLEIYLLTTITDAKVVEGQATLHAQDKSGKDIIFREIKF